MKRIGSGVTIALFCAAISTIAWSATSSPSSTTDGRGPAIHIEDVESFFKIYDAAAGHPTADQLQHEYIDPGSDGLHQFAELRNITGDRIAKALDEHPEMYSGARRCMAVLPSVRRRLQVALRKLSDLYPEARFPPVTIAVGRGRPVGVTTSTSGVLIGLEALCATNWLNPNVEDRFVHTIAHEYGHVQQTPALLDDPNPTVLEASLIEGGAELTAELISGDVGYSQFKLWTKGREKELETAFVPDENQTDLSRWLNNANPEKATPDKPGDLGYWVGYRIVKTYYQRAPDKRVAVRDILQINDPQAFLAKSGWYPGIQLQ